MSLDWGSFSDADVRLLPYWLAGRVSDETQSMAMDFLDEENREMRGILAAAVVELGHPVTEREWVAMLFEEDLFEAEQAFVAGGGLVTRQLVDAWIRDHWRFEQAESAADEFEGAVLEAARTEGGVACVVSVSRIGAGNERRRFYIGVVEKDMPRQQDFRLHVTRGLRNAFTTRTTLDRDIVRVPLVESIRLGWDWPVYYRDMVANSQLIWSASGEDIDLHALADSQPHDH